MPNTCKSNGNDGSLLPGVEWRTGEEYLGICPCSGGQLGETQANTAYALRGKAGDLSGPCAIG
jgi:hypothetical protein